MASLWNPKAKKWVAGRKDLSKQLDQLRQKQAGRRTVWMHCASLGEYEQGRPLLERLRSMDPALFTVLTFFSPSGYEVMKDKDPADHVMYLPQDSKTNAKNFIDAVNPSLVLWVKYEYWFNYLAEIKKRQLPVLLISGIFRKDQHFFSWYGGIWRRMLHCFDHLFVQTENAKSLLATIGIKDNVTVDGDTRFDRVVEIADKQEPLPQSIIDFCGDSSVIVAGSTWEEDEDELDHFANTHPEIKFIVAPHEIDKEHIKEIRHKFKHTLLFSEIATDDRVSRPLGATHPNAFDGRVSHPSGVTHPNVLIIDNIGMLSRLYRLATISYVGGGFGSDGVHNVLEAAVYGIPVIFGPEYEKYIEATELLECGGAISIDNALELERALDVLLNDKDELEKTGIAARDYVRAKAGATERIINYIQVNRLLIS